jgi:subtilisin family serine protease
VVGLIEPFILLIAGDSPVSAVLWCYRKQCVGKARRAITLIEQLVVLAIIAMVMALSTSAYLAVVGKANTVSHIVTQEEIRVAALTGAPLRAKAPPPRKGKPGYVPDRYMIQFDDTVADADAEAKKIAAAYPGSKVLHVFDFGVFKGCNLFIPGITFDVLTAHAGVKIAERERLRWPCAEIVPTGVRRISHLNAGRRLDPIQPFTVGLPNVSGSLTQTQGNKGIVIGVMDTGVDKRHPDLNVTKIVPLGGDSVDEDGHGTHCAGTIGARKNNRGVVGVFPGVEIWALDISDGVGNLTDAAAFAGYGFILANAKRLHVVNMSFGAPRSDMENFLVDKCAEAGVIMVAAAGNDADNAFFYSPASADKAVCVAALDDSNGVFGNDDFAVFSNFGRVVDVISPGVDILSTLPGNQYGVQSGTSMAAPHIAGLMGLYYFSTVNTGQFTQPRRANGLEIASLFCRVRGAELIPGIYDRFFPPFHYPLLVHPSKVR